LWMRKPMEKPARKAAREKFMAKPNKAAAFKELDDDVQQRFEALRTWRTQIAREHNLPAYIIFHDATLLAIAQLNPQNSTALAQVQGMGTHKLVTYGQQVLEVLGQ
jgi:ATP-dependent DNA helicase RecQ